MSIVKKCAPAGKFARHLLTSCALGAALTTPLMAQQTQSPPPAGQEEDQDQDPNEEIIVTGSFAESLADALRIKREADSITDAVSASDIGNFPAANVAEALQRVPGVSISREAGEGQFVSVRGLGPNFQSVTLNGSPIAFNENIRNSDQSGRQFQFRVIPADLISAIVVAKTPTPDLIDGGIGSNIDIRTARPLDIKPFVTAAVSGHYEDRTREVTPNASISASWRNPDSTFGVIAGVSYQTRDVQFDRYQHFGYTNRTIDGQTVAVPSNITLTLEREDRRRVSFMGGLQWQPSQSFLLTLDTLYSNFNNVIDEDRVLFELGSRADLAARLAPGSAVITNGVLTAGEVRGGRVSRNGEYSEQTHENLFGKLTAAYSSGDWTVTPSFSYSNAQSQLDVPLQRIEGRTADNAPGLVYSYDLGANPVEDRRIVSVLTNLDLTTPGSAAFFRYRIRPTNSEDIDKTALLDIQRDIGADLGGITIERVRIGGQYTDRSRDYQRRDRELTARPGTIIDASFVDQRLPRNAFDQTIGNRYPPINSYNRDAFGGAFVVAGEFDGSNPQSDDLVPTGADRQQSYEVDEEILAFYGRLDFAGDALGAPLSGNLGLRWAKTDTLVRGTLLTAETVGGRVTTVVTPREFEGSYEEFLPSVNLTFALRPNVLLRLAAARTLTRPSLADLRTATVPNSSLVSDIFDRGQIAIDQSVPSARNGVGGNAALNPYTAINFDASAEWYFEEFGAISVAAFHKDISDFIGSIARTESVVFATRSGDTLTADLLITRPQNIGKASITGIEAGFSYKFPFGFGLAASATYTDSSGRIETAPGVFSDAQLQGVSDTSYSISPFFERGPFEVRLSYTFRSEFTANGNISPGSNAVTDPDAAIVADGFGTLDLGASLKFAERFEAFVEGTNILDARQAVYQGSRDQLFQLHEFGRSFNVGIRARF